jgi:hypothetical protein
VNDELLLARLSRVKLDSENDVREEFVTPLLRMLGYDHDRGEIRRAKSLSTPYQSGTKRKEYIVPDYIMECDGRPLFVIDAKVPGKSVEDSLSLVLDRGYVGQVHSYAAHREVQAPYFAITNGHYTAVYETNNEHFNPALVVQQSVLQTEFENLARAVSKNRLSRLVAQRFEPSWSIEVRHREIGFQAINLAVGDFNADGLPEIAIALSEKRIPILDLHGAERASIETDGWVWWVAKTNAIGADEASLVALQHTGAGPDGSGGRIIGINGSRILWSQVLARGGSGFEELDRIGVSSQLSTIIFAAASDNVISAITPRGESLWNVRVSDATGWASTMHVRLRRDGRSVFVTCGRQTTGVAAAIDVRDGKILHSVELPFRGAQVESLSDDGTHALVGSADTAELALIEWATESIVATFNLPFGTRYPKIAVELDSQLVALGAAGDIVCCKASDLLEARYDPFWRKNDFSGHVNRMSWVSVRGEKQLLIAARETAIPPSMRPGGIYLVDETGETVRAHVLSTKATMRGMFGPHPAGIRDVRNISGPADRDIELVAIASDSRLYMWRPT